MDPNHHHLSRKASQETMISLLQLDPAPMDSGSIYEKELPPLPEPDVEDSTASLKSRDTSASAQSSLSSLGLSGGKHGPIYYLTRIQRYSSYTFAVFAGLHFANTSLIPLIYQNVPSAEPFLLMTREIYQTRISEPLLVGLPIVGHVLAGVALRLLRRSQNLRRYGGSTPGMYALHRAATANTTASSSSSSSRNGLRIWPLVSYVSMSGYALVLPLAGHIFMNRVLPLLVEGDSSNIGLEFVSHGFAREGVKPWIAYALLLSLGVGHMVWGAATWLGVAPPTGWKKTTIDRKLRKQRRRMWWGINGVAALVAGVWAAGGLGVVATAGRVGGYLGKVYDNVYDYTKQ